MKLGSLFDGSGGFPLAGAHCGITPVWASEIEPYPIAVTKSRFPFMKHYGDISKINGAEIEPVDIITFGSPCQDLSVAGKRAGLKHEANGDDETTRSGLFMEAVRIIKEMREATNGEFPRFALWENVPGAFSSNKGEDFRIVCEELIKIVEPSAVMPAVPKKGWSYADSYIGDGWSLAYRVFDAQYWGVPQRRRRIHLVCDFRGECAGEVLFERKGLRGHLAESGAEREEASRNAENGIGTADRETESERDVNDLILDDQGGQQISVRTDGKSPTLRAEMHGNVPCVINALGGNAESYDQSEVVPTLSAINAHIYPCVATYVCEEPQVIAFDRAAFNQGINAQYDFEVTDSGINSTLVAKGPSGVAYKEQEAKYIVRRLTPTECARLQGFPDLWGHFPEKEDFTDEEYAFWLEVRNTHAEINGKTVKEYTKEQMVKWYNKLHTDSAEYKCWGNGIALPPALYCMQGIVEVLRERVVR